MPMRYILMMETNQPKSLSRFSMNNQIDKKFPYSWLYSIQIQEIRIILEFYWQIISNFIMLVKIKG